MNLEAILKTRAEAGSWHAICTQEAVCFLALGSSVRICVSDPTICDWVEEARSRATGLVLTQPDGRLYTSRFEKPGQPARFSFCFLLQRVKSGSRKTFASSWADARPSGSVPRLYSAMRFFHLRKSVMLCGSTRTSTRRRLASSRFISYLKPVAVRRFLAEGCRVSILLWRSSSKPQLAGS